MDSFRCKQNASNSIILIKKELLFEKTLKLVKRSCALCVLFVNILSTFELKILKAT